MDKDQLLKEWVDGAHIKSIAHHKAAAKFNRNNRILGLLTTIFTVIVSTSIFASLMKTDNKIILMPAYVISFLAVILSASNTFLKLEKLSEKHLQAGISYGQIRKKMELLLVNVKNVNENHLNEIIEQNSELEKNVPSIPQKIHDNAKNEVKKSSNK